MTRECGPYVCPFPDPTRRKAGDWWTCPICGTTYRLSKSIPQRRWRNWYAPNGHWRLPTWRDRWFAPRPREDRVDIPLTTRVYDSDGEPL